MNFLIKNSNSMVNKMLTLSEAKKYLHDNVSQGVICPCCNRYNKMYTRKITSSMAYGLILIYNSVRTDKFHLEKLLKEIDCPPSIRGDLSKFVHWGVLQKYAGEKKDGNPSLGYYQITKIGVQFIFNEIKLPKYLMILNNEVIFEADEKITIRKAIQNKFYYNNLINS